MGLQSLPQYGKADTTVGYPEQYSHATFKQYVSGDEARKGNVNTIIKAFDAYIQQYSGTQRQKATPTQKQQRAKYEDMKKTLVQV